MALENDIKILARVPIFMNLEPEALKLVAFAAETRAYRAGDVLFRQGEISEGGFIVISGAVALDSSQNAAAAAKILGEGALLGELALLVSTRNPATAIARRNSTVLKIKRSLFLRTLEESPVSAARLKRSLALKLEGFTVELAKSRQNFLD